MPSMRDAMKSIIKGIPGSGIAPDKPSYLVGYQETPLSSLGIGPGNPIYSFWKDGKPPRAGSYGVDNSALTNYQREQEQKELRNQQQTGQRRNAAASARSARRPTLLTDAFDLVQGFLGGSAGQKTLLGL